MIGVIFWSVLFICIYFFMKKRNLKLKKEEAEKLEKLKKEEAEKLEKINSLKSVYIEKYKGSNFTLNSKFEYDQNGHSINDIINSKTSLYDIFDISPKIERSIRLLNKYGTDIGNKLIRHEYFLDMTIEQLIDCKGEPNKVEREELRTKVNEIYIYGNKSSGDIFVFVNNKLERFKDR